MKKKLPITISEKALSKILKIKAKKDIADEYYLRLGIKSAGCGVASYIIGFDHLKEKDEIFEFGELKIIIEKMQLMYLAGKSIDFGEADGVTGFIFRENN